MKTAIILRAVSGSGKTTLASELTKHGGVVCCADDFFMVNGEYKFDATKLYHVHNQCKDKFLQAVKTDISPVIVANTNVNERAFKEYHETAVAYGYTVFYLVVENRHGGVNVHNCPSETLTKQEASIRATLKLQQYVVRI